MLREGNRVNKLLELYKSNTSSSLRQGGPQKERRPHINKCSDDAGKMERIKKSTKTNSLISAKSTIDLDPRLSIDLSTEKKKFFQPLHNPGYMSEVMFFVNPGI